jgi:acetoin utilization protein AcuB
MRDIMTARVVTVEMDDRLLLLAHRISCIPIVDDEFKPIGIVSWRDLLKSLGPA